MQETLDQFLTVLRFSHYYILHRLRQGRKEEEYQSLLKMVMTRYEDGLKDEYEVLYKAVVRTEREYIVTYQTQTNIRTGTVHLYSGNVSTRTFPMKLVDQVEPVALYHKAMPFEDIITLAREKRRPSSKRFHHKLSDRMVQIKNADTLTAPSPTPVSHSLFNTPIKRVGFEGHFPPVEVCMQPIQEAISKRLMLVSDSDEEGPVLKVQQGVKHGEKDDEEEIVIVVDRDPQGEKESQKDEEPRQAMSIKKLRNVQQQKVFKGTHTSHRTHQVTQKKTTSNDPNPPITPSRKWQKNHQATAREQRRRQQEQRLSKFMSGWMSKKQVGK